MPKVIRKIVLAIGTILFTLLSKIVILPVTVWVHKNSIKMVRIQPEINFLKAKYYGDLDTVATEQSKLFKREKYSPAASIVSLILQLFLLSSIITIIYHPLTYLLGVSPETVAVLAEQYGIEQGISATEGGGATGLKRVQEIRTHGVRDLESKKR